MGASRRGRQNGGLSGPVVWNVNRTRDYSSDSDSVSDCFGSFLSFLGDLFLSEVRLQKPTPRKSSSQLLYELSIQLPENVQVHPEAEAWFKKLHEACNNRANHGLSEKDIERLKAYYQTVG